MKKHYSLLIKIAALAGAAFLAAPAVYADSLTPSLSQTSVTVGLGQSAVVTSQASSTAVYVASNSGPSAALFSINGAQITVTGNQIGGTMAAICYAGTASNCANLSVSVQASPVAQAAVAFSQNNITLAPGQNTAVTLSGGTGYMISNNSNAGAVQAGVSGSTVSLVAGGSSGAASISVCFSDGSGCSALSATVGSSSNSTSSLSFDQANPSVSVGQVFNVNISGGVGFYVTNNTNPNVASHAISGNALVVSGLSNGTTTISLCSIANVCGSVNVAVSSSGVSYSSSSVSSGGSQSVVFGLSNPTVAIGQSMNVSLSGGSGYFVSSNPNPNIAQGSVSGNSLALSGVSAGAGSLVVCASAGGCSTLYVKVANPAATVAPAAAAPAVQIMANSFLLAQIQSLQNQLAQVLSQIQSMQAALNQLAAAAQGIPQSAQGAQNGDAAAVQTGKYLFLQPLSLGSSGADVAELQKRLTAGGFYSGSVTGYYGELTKEAVMEYQTAHGISPLGNVGPGTRAALNAGE